MSKFYLWYNQSKLNQQMSVWTRFMDTVKENKIIIGSVAGVAAAFIIFKALTEEEKPVAEMTQNERFLHEIDELKQRVNVAALGKDDMKEIFDFLLKTTHKRLADHNASFKQQRRALKSADVDAYLNCLVNGFTKMQEITVEVNTQILDELGISEQQFQMATMQNQDIMNYMPQFEPVVKFRELTIQQTQEALKFQKVYLENHGQELVQNIKAISESWDQGAKQMLPIIFGLAMSDQIYEGLGFEEEQVEQARVKYQRNLGQEMAGVQEAVAPLIGQLSSSPMFGMGGMGGMGQGMEGMDPAAYENFMNMMGMDPSMLEGMDPSMLGFDPSMMGGMNFDPAMMEQIASYAGNQGAQQRGFGF